MAFELPLEVQLIIWLQNIISRNDVLIVLFSLISELGASSLTGLLVSFLYLAYDKHFGLQVACDITCAQLGTCMVKNVVRRLRPYAANEMIKCLDPVEDGHDIHDMNKQGYSFPSGHTTNIASLVTALRERFSGKKTFVIGSVLVGLVGLSRFVLGVHYPSDVLAGAFLGMAVVLFRRYFGKRFGEERNDILSLLIAYAGIFFCHSDDYFSSLGLLTGFVLGGRFERAHVHFANTRQPVKAIVRTILGGLVLLGVSGLLKIPFADSFLEADQLISHLYRTFRYSCGSFTVIGLLPYVFRYDLLRLGKE